MAAEHIQLMLTIQMNHICAQAASQKEKKRKVYAFSDHSGSLLGLHPIEAMLKSRHTSCEACAFALFIEGV